MDDARNAQRVLFASCSCFLITSSPSQKRDKHVCNRWFPNERPEPGHMGAIRCNHPNCFCCSERGPSVDVHVDACC